MCAPPGSNLTEAADQIINSLRSDPYSMTTAHEDVEEILCQMEQTQDAIRSAGRDVVNGVGMSEVTSRLARDRVMELWKDGKKISRE